MAQPYKVSTINIQYALKVAADAGINPEEILRRTGLKWEAVLDADGWVSSTVDQQIGEEIARMAGDEYFFLREMQTDDLSRNNIGWYYFFNAPTMQEGARRAETTFRLISKGTYPKMSVQGDEFTMGIAYRSPDYRTSQHMVDFAMSLWWQTLRLFAGDALTLQAVRIVNDDPERIPVYEKYFGVPCQIRQQVNELVMPAENFYLPNVYKVPEKSLDSVLEKFYAHTHSEFANHNPSPFREAFFNALQKQLIHGKPTQPKIAKLMGMSTRTLQRKMMEANTTFTKLLEETRRDLAKGYLSQPDLNITDVALMLGYSESTSFTSAFRRWYGASPRAFRRHNIG